MLKKILCVSIILSCAYIWAQEISNDVEVKKSEKIVGAQSIGDVKIEIVNPTNSPMGVHTRMNVQGYLLYNNQPVNGSVPITFSIWDQYSGGNKVWGDEVDTVYCTSGLFNYLIGGKVPINPSVFTGGTYRTLQMVINGQTMPRIILTTVGWAFSAGKSDSSAWAYNADKLDDYHGGTTGPNIYPRTNASGKLNSSVIPPISSSYADSAGGSARIGGQTLSGLDSRFVNTNEANSVTSSMIVDGNVTSTDIQNGTITGTDVADNSLTGSDIASLSVPLGDLSQSGASTGQIIQWNGSQWAPATLTVSNADMVDGFHASSTPTPNTLFPLDSHGRINITYGNNSYYAIRGYHSGNNCGVYGGSSGSAGVYGVSSSSHGVQGQCEAPSGSERAGVYGWAINSGNYGVYARSPQRGLYALATTSSGDRYGAYIAASGIAEVWLGTVLSGSQYAGYFNGNVRINGNLSKTSGSFLIDHPLDPLDKTLRHNFVESPENLCLYRGKITLDTQGQAVVKMPDYFAALTKENEATVTITPIGKPFNVGYDWNSNLTEFVVYGEPNRSVSYIVLADRDDPAMRMLYRPVVEDKKGPEKGRLLNPEAYGYPKEMGIDFYYRENLAKMQLPEIENIENTIGGKK